MPIDAKPTEPVETLAAVRQTVGVSQAQVAAELGTTQLGILKVERSSDPRWSTITRYLGGVAAAAGEIAETQLTVAIGRRRFSVAFPAEAEEGGNEVTPPPTAGAPSTATETRSDVWRLRAWDDPALEDRFLVDNAIAISADEIGDLSAWPSESELRARLRDAFPSRTEQAIGTFVGYWRMFCVEIQPGDLVIVPLTGRRAAIGEIASGYTYKPDEPDARFRHRRVVRWLRTTLRSQLDDDVRKVVNAPGTICRINAADAAERIVAAS